MHSDNYSANNGYSYSSNSSNSSSNSNSNSNSNNNSNFNNSSSNISVTKGRIHWTDYMVEMLMVELSESQYWTSMQFKMLENDVSKRLKDKYGIAACNGYTN